MMDLLFLAATAGFFALTFALLRMCERLRPVAAPAGTPQRAPQSSPGESR